jgi:hypothetical protein
MGGTEPINLYPVLMYGSFLLVKLLLDDILTLRDPRTLIERISSLPQNIAELQQTLANGG